MQIGNASRITAHTKLVLLATASALILLSGSFQSSFALSAINLNEHSKTSVTQYVGNDGKTLTIDTITLQVKKKSAKSEGQLTVTIMQDKTELASKTIAIDSKTLHKKQLKVTADFDALQVTGDFLVKVSYDGKGGILILREKASKSNYEGHLVGKSMPKGWNLAMKINAQSSPSGSGDNQNPPPSPPPPPPQVLTGKISFYAYRIPSQYWGPTFVGSNAQMYFVLYDSNGNLVKTGFSDENGSVFTELESGKTYYVVPTDCNACHGGTHDVAFNHWEDGSTTRARAVVASSEAGAASVGAYFEYIPHDEVAPTT